MDHNFPMICPDENDSKPPSWDFNKKTLLKWLDGVHFEINLPPNPIEVDSVDSTKPSEISHNTHGMEVVVQSADPSNQVVVFGTQGKYQPSRKLLGVPANRDAGVLHRVNEAGVELGNPRYSTCGCVIGFELYVKNRRVLRRIEAKEGVA